MTRPCLWPGCGKPGPLCSRDRSRVRTLRLRGVDVSDPARWPDLWAAHLAGGEVYRAEPSELSAWRSTLVAVLGDPARDIGDPAALAANVIRTLRADLSVVTARAEKAEADARTRLDGWRHLRNAIGLALGYDDARWTDDESLVAEVRRQIARPALDETDLRERARLLAEADRLYVESHRLRREALRAIVTLPPLPEGAP